MKSIQLILSVLLLACPAFAADSITPAHPSAPDPLAEALSILQAHYIHYAALQVKEGDRLDDLITRSKGEISVLQPQTNSPSSLIVTALLPNNIVYWRVASFKPEKNWADLNAQLDAQAQSSVIGLVLDLRSNSAPDDYVGAAQLASLFTQDQAAPFKILHDSSDANLEPSFRPERSFRQPIVILVNHQTKGAAEVLAESLRRQGALVIGQATPGMAAIFAEQKLASGQVLRYMTGSVTLVDGTDLWNHPVTPDVSLNADDKTEASALDLIAQGQVADVIGESAERHRLSEAALVQGQDPEQDAYLAAHEKKPVLLSLPVIHDAVLISALDSLKVIGLSQRQTASSTAADLHPSATASAQ